MTTPRNSPHFISFKATCIRAALYILIVVAIMQGVFYEGTFRAENGFVEASFTEFLQSALLATSVLLLLYVRQGLKQFRQVALLIAAFLLASLIREQDALLDRHVADGAWQVLVSLVVIPSLVVVIRGRRRFIEEFEQYANSFSFGLFAAGFLGTYVFSRLYGRGAFWETLLADNYQYVFKRAAEEITELFGYTLLLFAVIELVLMARRRLRSP